MIDKYLNGVIEQIYNRVGKTDRNIVMVNYSNDFSIRKLEKVEEYSQQDSAVYFAWTEYVSDRMIGAYEPFLNVICDMFREYGDGDFDAFMDKCGVYSLQQPVFKSFYETGKGVRTEGVLLDEVEYEQKRMTEAILAMLEQVAEIRPVVIVINRFQYAAVSTLNLINGLLKRHPMNVGVVLGINESHSREDLASVLWAEIKEQIADYGQVYHAGTTGIRRADTEERGINETDVAAQLELIENMAQLLDFEQARKYCQKIERKVKFEGMKLDKDIYLDFMFSYAKISVLLGELSKALELVSEVMKLSYPKREHEINYRCAFLAAICYMYQGKLDKSLIYVKMAKDEAVNHGDEEEIFQADLLMAQAQMSGWHNIFFCVQDIPIDGTLIERMLKYNFRNYLAHVYVYAYDNRPEVVAKAYRSEAALTYFSKGVSLAKEIGNEQLVYSAYQKNIMLASSNGMNEIAMLYSIRSYQFMKDKQSQLGARIFSGIGYNLSALGYNEKAEAYYNRAIEQFYSLKDSEDIAEVFYNRALNKIMMEQYVEAEHDMLLALKAVERLHLNSLRVCNLSKMYAIIALCYALQNDIFNCERYLLNCRQFLDYIIAREDYGDKEAIHDYAVLDDDMFLYSYASALLHQLEGDNESAFADYEKAEKYLVAAEGNEFFIYRIYRQSRMELFQEMGRTELQKTEAFTLETHDEMTRQLHGALTLDLLEDVEIGDEYEPCMISESEIDALVKQEGLARDYKNVKNQMDFISSWQKMIDVNNGNVDAMVKNAMHTFSNHFSTDRALYIWYEGDKPRILYNDLEMEISKEFVLRLESIMQEYPQGFAVSKISDDWFDHQDAMELFGDAGICSFVAVPFYNSGKISSLLITYVKMKENWHSSSDRFMLNDDDLKVFQLLFREMSYSIKRMEASAKIHEMNRKLQEVAITDMLTGAYNRIGMYEVLNRKIREHKDSDGRLALGLMFIDLDNFKGYNDSLGHDVGDLILCEMSKTFADVAASQGTVCRYGGDEFLIVFDTDDKDKLEKYAQGIYQRIEESDGFREKIESYIGREIQIDAKRKITCSIGISTNSDVKTEEDVNHMIKVADDILYSVKSTTKGNYAFI